MANAAKPIHRAPMQPVRDRSFAAAMALGASPCRRLGGVMRTPESQTPVLHEGFAKHLHDAIAINRQRRAYYSRLTGGQSEALTDRLVWQERMALLAAYYFDFRARPFQQQGIPIVSGDFVPMAGVRPAGSPVLRRSGAAVADLETARAIISDLKRRLGAALGRPDFSQVAKACFEALDAFEALEERSGAAFTMSRHVIESLGLGALNARKLASASGGKTVGLSCQFLRAQSWALGTTVETDQMAQPLNARNVGILVNDIPSIPFKRRYCAEIS